MTKPNKPFDQEQVSKLSESIRSTILECFTKAPIVRSCIFQERVINGGISDKLLYSKTVNPNHIRIWGWFEDLIDCRDAPISPINMCDMGAYFGLMWIKPSSEEISILRLIDKVFIETVNKNDKK